MEHDVEHDDTEHRSDWIDQNSFPLQNFTRWGCGVEPSQERDDDGWSRHHEHRAQQPRCFPVQVGHKVDHKRGDYPCHQNTDGDQARNNTAPRSNPANL